LKKTYSYLGALVALAGVVLLFLPSPKPFVSSNGSASTLSYVLNVEKFTYGSFNVSLPANASVRLHMDAEFLPPVIQEAYSMGEGCIDLYVLDQNNYQRWMEKVSQTAYVTSSGVHLGSFIFQTDSVPKIYYVVLDNAWRDQGKVVNVQLTITKMQSLSVSSRQISGYQMAGLSSLSMGVIVGIYGLAKEAPPPVKDEDKVSEEANSQGPHTISPSEQE
jgi:hypothetical protein